MIIIITMAGLGSRFRKAGYDCPKYMIKAKDKTLFELSLESLEGYKSHVSKYIFVARKEDKARKFILEKTSKYFDSDIDIIELESATDGQATTCMFAMPYCNDDEEILIYNIDTYVEPFAMNYESISGDGHIPCFKAEGNHWSFVRLDDSGRAVEVREKIRISDNCSLGAYYFSSAGLYRKLYEELYSDKKNYSNEKYIAPIYNFMIEKGMNVTISLVESSKVHVLGTPEELEEFVKATSKKIL